MQLIFITQGMDNNFISVIFAAYYTHDEVRLF